MTWEETRRSTEYRFLDSAQEDAFEDFWESLGDVWVGLSPKDMAKLAWSEGYKEARAKGILDRGG